MTKQPLGQKQLQKSSCQATYRLVTETEPDEIQSNHPVKPLGQPFPDLEEKLI